MYMDGYLYAHINHYKKGSKNQPSCAGLPYRHSHDFGPREEAYGRENEKKNVQRPHLNLTAANVHDV